MPDSTSEIQKAMPDHQVSKSDIDKIYDTMHEFVKSLIALVLSGIGIIIGLLVVIINIPK